MRLERVLKVFDIKLGTICRTEHKTRWQNVLNALQKEDEERVVAEFNEVLKLKGIEKHPLYYMEAVRRNLLLKQHTERKSDKRVPQCLKEIFRGMSI